MNKSGRLPYIVWGVIAVAVVAALLPSHEAPKPKSAEQLAVEAREEKAFQDVVRVAQWLKSRAKNPDSFNLVYAGRSSTGAVCVEYRATNSFNAVITERYVMSNEVSGASAELWNAHCSQRAMQDFTYARQAL